MCENKGLKRKLGQSRSKAAAEVQLLPFGFLRGGAVLVGPWTLESFTLCLDLVAKGSQEKPSFADISTNHGSEKFVVGNTDR